MLLLESEIQSGIFIDDSDFEQSQSDGAEVLALGNSRERKSESFLELES